MEAIGPISEWLLADTNRVVIFDRTKLSGIAYSALRDLGRRYTIDFLQNLERNFPDVETGFLLMREWRESMAFIKERSSSYHGLSDLDQNIELQIALRELYPSLIADLSNWHTLDVNQFTFGNKEGQTAWLTARIEAIWRVVSGPLRLPDFTEAEGVVSEAAASLRELDIKTRIYPPEAVGWFNFHPRVEGNFHGIERL